MNHEYIFFLGLGSIKKTYQKLVDSAPEEAVMHLFSAAEEMRGSSLPELEQSVLRFLEENDLTQPRLIGHSMGGAMALWFAHRYPDKVEHLYLIDPAGIYDNKSYLNSAINFLSSTAELSVTDIPLLTQSAWAMVKRPVWNLRMSHFAHKADFQKEAQALRVPTTLFWGEKDKVMPLWQGERLHSLLPQSELVVLPKKDHNWILKHPEKFWEKVVQ